MGNRLFIDTNILLDFYLWRGDTSNQESIDIIFHDIENKQYEWIISLQSIVTIEYILSRYKVKKDDIHEFIAKIESSFSIVGWDNTKIRVALRNNEFSDFEDSVQNQLALESVCDIIITNNIQDFTWSPIEVRSPISFIRDVFSD